MLFIEQRDVLVTAGRDGSSLFKNNFNLFYKINI